MDRWSLPVPPLTYGLVVPVLHAVPRPARLDEQPESGGELPPLPLDDVERDLVHEPVDLGEAAVVAAAVADALVVVLSPPLLLLFGLFSGFVKFTAVT